MVNLKLDMKIKTILNWLRTYNKEIILLINKIDNKKMIRDNNIYYELGIKKNFFILSCSHNLGFKKLFEYFINNDNKKNINNIKKIPIDIDVGIFWQAKCWKKYIFKFLFRL